MSVGWTISGRDGYIHENYSTRYHYTYNYGVAAKRIVICGRGLWLYFIEYNDILKYRQWQSRDLSGIQIL